MYKVEPLPRADKKKEQEWKKLKRELRKEKREHRPLERGENYQNWEYPPLRVEKREEYQLK